MLPNMWDQTLTFLEALLAQTGAAKFWVFGTASKHVLTEYT
jgi:hypothetical protein